MVYLYISNIIICFVDFGALLYHKRWSWRGPMAWWVGRVGCIVFTNSVIIDYHYRYYSCVGRVQVTGLRETGIRTGSRKARITRVSHWNIAVRVRPHVPGEVSTFFTRIIDCPKIGTVILIVEYWYRRQQSGFLKIENVR